MPRLVLTDSQKLVIDTAIKSKPINLAKIARDLNLKYRTVHAYASPKIKQVKKKKPKSKPNIPTDRPLAPNVTLFEFERVVDIKWRKTNGLLSRKSPRFGIKWVGHRDLTYISQSQFENKQGLIDFLLDKCFEREVGSLSP